MSSDTQLEAIRAKTDRDLATLLQRALERGARGLRRGNISEAEFEYAEAAKLLALADGLPGRTFQEFSTQVTGLRSDLDRSVEICISLAS